jgi:hypothetical protein
VLANTTTAWRNADCDGDGVKNYDEATGQMETLRLQQIIRILRVLVALI